MKKSRMVWLGTVMAMTACGQIAAEPIDSAEQNAIVGVADPTDPYTCEMKDGYDPDADEPQLSMQCTATGGACFSNAESRATADGWHAWAYGACEHSCDVDADCPMPTSGTSSPICFRWQDTPAGFPGSCVLPCGGGQACPNGFYCFQPGLMSCGSCLLYTSPSPRDS